MSPESITAISSTLTTVTIAATAVAAIIQLRHMRAGNAIEAILSFRSMLDDEEHRKAFTLLRGGELSRALGDPQFRRYLYRTSKKLSVEDVPTKYLDLHQSAISLGNGFELIGGMVRNRIVPAHIFLQNYWWVVDNSWGGLEEYIAMMREYTGSEGLFEDFEFLTVASRKWAEQNPNSYAQGVPRIPVTNPYPLERQPWFNEAD